MCDLLDAGQHDTWRSGASFSLKHRVYRAVWNCVWFLLASWTPPPLHGWRRLLLRIFGATVASTAGIYGSARIWYPKNLTIGRYAFIGPGVNVYCIAPITLESYSLVSQGSHLCSGTHDIEDVHFQLEAKPIKICRRAWVAAETFVGPGVTINEGAVLGARGVAFSDLAAWTIYAGNPARPIKQRMVRFSDL